MTAARLIFTTKTTHFAGKAEESLHKIRICAKIRFKGLDTGGREAGKHSRQRPAEIAVPTVGQNQLGIAESECGRSGFCVSRPLSTPASYRSRHLEHHWFALCCKRALRGAGLTR